MLCYARVQGLGFWVLLILRGTSTAQPSTSQLYFVVKQHSSSALYPEVVISLKLPCKPSTWMWRGKSAWTVAYPLEGSLTAFCSVVLQRYAGSAYLGYETIAAALGITFGAMQSITVLHVKLGRWYHFGKAIHWAITPALAAGACFDRIPQGCSTSLLLVAV